MKAKSIEGGSKKGRRLTEMLVLFLIAFVPRVILIFAVADPLRTPMDELSTMSVAAYLAGYDWTAVVEYGNHYYGGGMTILMTPLFMLIEDPTMLYRACLVFCAVLQSLVAPIAYHILSRYMGIQKKAYLPGTPELTRSRAGGASRNKVYLYLVSLAAGFLMVNRALVIYNEHMLVLVSWLVALALCRLVSESQKEAPDYRVQAVWSVVLMLLLSYSLTLHTRAKTLWCALLVLVVLYYLFYKKWLVAKIPTLISGALGYWLANRFILWCKTTLWLWQEGDELRNTSVQLNLSKDLLTSPVSWEGWFATVVGQVHTSLTFTGGFAAIVITLMVIYLCRNGKQIFVKKKQPQIENTAQLAVKPYILVLGAFFIMCIGATILAQSVTWMFRVQDALLNSTYDTNAYGYKAFTYFRYYGAYMGPFFLAGAAYIYHYKEYLKKYLPAIFTVFAVLEVLFLCVVLPHITKNRVASEVYWPFGLNQSFDVQMRARVYLAGVLVSSLSFLVMFLALWKGKRTVPVALLLVLLVYQYTYNGIYYDGSFCDRHGEKAYAGYELVSALEDAGYELPEELYVVGYKASLSQKPTYTYQFLLKNYSIIPELPDRDVEEAIVLCQKEGYKKLLNRGYSYVVLDDDECIYVKGEEYIQMIEEYLGVTFTE